MTQQFPRRTSAIVYFIGVAGSLLIMAALAWFMSVRTRPAPLNQTRAAERAKNLREVTAAAAQAVNNYAWIDKNKGLVQLPVARAMEMTLQQAQNPQQARSNLLARVEKATAQPPKAPEKPSPFE